MVIKLGTLHSTWFSFYTEHIKCFTSDKLIDVLVISPKVQVSELEAHN